VEAAVPAAAITAILSIAVPSLYDMLSVGARDIIVKTGIQ
jgi:hypothetical protein